MQTTDVFFLALEKVCGVEPLYLKSFLPLDCGMHYVQVVMLPYFGLVGDNCWVCAVYSQEHGDVLIILDKIFEALQI